ncbi:flagellin [Pararhodobacter zhoushanensis]|uniref:flagellin n=1 Tax=Pararhodobacter zhoushanensis TaxID=2479545 RepID=UPI000F8DE614|nr:flagellin [Pararhodobacter zhoushanensis]
MTWLSIGTLALPATLKRHGLAMRAEVARLGIELTTGERVAPQKQLRGDLGALSAIEARTTRIAAYAEAAKQASAATEAAQKALERASTMGSDTASRMLAVSIEGTTPATLRTAATAARGALEDLTSTLSQRIAGRALFSGTASDMAPLPNAETVLATLAPALVGLTSAQDVANAINTEIITPGGLFDTALYQGGPAASGAAIDRDSTVAPLPTAADPSLRQLLAGLVMSAVAGDDTLALTEGQRRTLARTGAEALLGAAPALAETQGAVGTSQERLDQTLTRLSGERDALLIARSDLVGADPYEAVTRLEEAQARLETLYAVTARTSRLNLTEYL